MTTTPRTRYRVMITAWHSYTIDLEAPDEASAIAKAQHRYLNGDPDSFTVRGGDVTDITAVLSEVAS